MDRDRHWGMVSITDSQNLVPFFPLSRVSIGWEFGKPFHTLGTITSPERHPGKALTHSYDFLSGNLHTLPESGYDYFC